MSELRYVFVYYATKAVIRNLIKVYVGGYTLETIITSFMHKCTRTFVFLFIFVKYLNFVNSTIFRFYYFCYFWSSSFSIYFSTNIKRYSLHLPNHSLLNNQPWLKYLDTWLIKCLLYESFKHTQYSSLL